MTKEQFEEEKRQIDTNYEKAKNELYIKFAKANNPYSIGDIVEDHCHIIKIEKLSVAFTFRKAPEMVYSGIELRKDLEPKKRQTNSLMYQSNIERKLN